MTLPVSATDVQYELHWPFPWSQGGLWDSFSHRARTILPKIVVQESPISGVAQKSKEQGTPSRPFLIRNAHPQDTGFELCCLGMGTFQQSSLGTRPNVLVGSRENLMLLLFDVGKPE